MLYHVHLYKNHSNSSISVHQYKNGSDFSIQTAHLLITNVDICKKFLLCIEDAVRDRDPLSPYLFLICAEILAILKRRNSDIKGIYLEIRKRKLLCQQMIHQCQQMVVNNLKTHVLNVLKYFANISGLLINYDKTQVIWIRNMKYSNHRLNAGNTLEWGKQQFKLLGIELDVDLDKIYLF